ncbi:MAG: 30S ribosomal protein S7 [Candidatus Diapherotrites archaeon]|nr:30S ribosomal protein S7 [Candidatus Micrarchaeota archaeon]MBU1939221.1 30S ribosomal protein S7 [Candidatus Micrarchaeota archaeon]
MKVFGKWDVEDVQISDISLANHITLEGRRIPHTFGRRAAGNLEKSSLNIIERLTNKVMRSGQGKRKLSGKYIRGRGSCGKKLQAMRIVEGAFEIIERETKENPIQILVRAIENAGPREDITRIKRGGISYTVSVDVSPVRRVDESLKNLALSAFSSSFNKKVSAEEALAKEIMLAAKEDNTSFSIKRRDEVERIAKSSR